MDSSLTSDEELHLSNSSKLEVKYRDVTQAIEKIIQDEKIRRLNLCILMLKDQTIDLHDEISLKDEKIISLEQDCKELRDRLAKTEEKLLQQEFCNNNQAANMKEMRAELKSLRNNPICTKKKRVKNPCLANDQEPLNHSSDNIRNCVSHDQKLSAENLLLKQQVCELKEELKNQKHASDQLLIFYKDRYQERRELETVCNGIIMNCSLGSMQKGQSLKRKDGLILSEDTVNGPSIEDNGSQDGCSVEKTQSLLTDTMKKLKFSEEIRCNLDNQISKLLGQIRKMNSQLEKYQSELNLARLSTSNIRSHPMKGKLIANKSLKRVAEDMSTDATIGTPDGGITRKKRASMMRGICEQTFVGEKSLFSITPFLNRTLNLESDTSENKPEKSKEYHKVSQLQTAPIDAVSKINNLVVQCDSISQNLEKNQAQEEQSSKITGSKSMLHKNISINHRDIRIETKKPVSCAGKLEIVEEDDDCEQQPMEDSSRAAGSFICPLPSQENVMDLPMNNVNTAKGRILKNKRKLLKLTNNGIDHEIPNDCEEVNGPALRAHRILGKEKYSNISEKSDQKLSMFSPLKRNRGVRGTRIPV